MEGGFGCNRTCEIVENANTNWPLKSNCLEKCSVGVLYKAMLILMLTLMLTLMLMPMSHIRLKVGGAPGPPLTEVRPHNRPNCCGQPLLTNYCGIFLGKQEIPYKQIREMLSAVKK